MPTPAERPSPTTKAVRSIPVRSVVDWVCRTGGFGGGDGFGGLDRALEGARIHRRLQQQRSGNYVAEVPVSARFEREHYILEIGGRVDGVTTSPAPLEVEEIKSVRRLPLDPDPLHLAQARLYAGMLATGSEAVRLVLTYFEVETESVRQFRVETDGAQERAFLQATALEIARWEDARAEWARIRNASLGAFTFPFAGFRSGQRSLAAAVYRAVRDGTRLLAEAPTGSGKTAAVLFGALKAMGEGRCDRIFFLTAKTVGQTVARQALEQCAGGGARIRWASVTAREKTCYCKTTKPCEVQDCPHAQAYYDRRKPVLWDWVESGTGRWQGDERAMERQACPFELSLDAALFADVIICDYNYFFDPDVGLKRFFEDPTTASGCVVLVDESHNLPDRAREMFSAELDRAPFTDLQRAIRPFEPRLARTCSAIGRALRTATRLEAVAPAQPSSSVGRWTHSQPDAPAPVLEAIERFLKSGAEWLERNRPSEFRASLMERWFEALRFQRTAERLGESGVTLLGKDAVRLHCLDPAPHLDQALNRVRAGVFFSGTLSPFEHFAKELGGAAAQIRIGSPFPPDHLRLFVADQVRTAFRSRDASLDAVTGLVEQFVRARPGNHLVFLPSHAYLRALSQRFATLHPAVAQVSQEMRMDETARASFLSALAAPEPGRVRVVFAILGGLFGEAIDLAAGSIAGVVVVGPGLPQIGFERDLLRARFGFDRAYLIPGMIRVIQAVGRLLRSPEDRGTALLIDERFSKAAWRALFPTWWQPIRVPDAGELAARLGTP